MGANSPSVGALTPAVNVTQGRYALDISWRQYIEVSLTLLLLTANVYLFHIEESLRLFDLLKVLVPFYLVYMLIPVKWRLPAMLGVAAVSLWVLVGWLAACIILMGIGIFLGITMLPVHWNIRAGLSALYIGGLIFYRGFAPDGLLKTAVVVIGVLLMFRSILYLYELKHEKQDPGWLKRALYFLLPPNFIFYIFPIVDWKTFVRSFYSVPSVEIYQQGLKWMYTGFIHLLVYRLLYYYAMPHPDHLDQFYGMLQYMVISYALIVRLSGLFHMSAGLLCLFGFKLPPTFHNYFIVTNFSELWRRINIYWKDFVMKVFYFPIYFKFKKRNLTAVFITVLIVFFFNWLLHGYQWFWIRGTFLLKDTDIIFWSLLGIFVAINSVLLSKKAGGKQDQRSEIVMASSTIAKIMGMFLIMSLLWGFWISPSVESWWQLLAATQMPTIKQLGFVLLMLLLVFALGVSVYFFLKSRKSLRDQLDQMHTPPIRWVQATSLMLFLLALPYAQNTIARLTNSDITPIYQPRLNALDEASMFKGYYDELILGNNINNQMWDKEAKKPENWGKLNTTDIIDKTDDIIGKKLKKNYSGVFKEKRISTNSLGLRDKEYSETKPEGVYRAALLGGSLEMGSGVSDEEVFEQILEVELNKLTSDEDSIEILNYSISGIHLPQHVGIVENRIVKTSPDMVIYTAHPSEKFRALLRFANVMRSMDDLSDYPYLEKVRSETAISKEDSEASAMRKISVYRDSLYLWGLRRIADYCDKNGLDLVYLDVPDLGRFVQKENRSELAAMVRENGFHYIDLWSAFDEAKKEDLMTAEFDQHPNEKGHLLIAEEFMRIFKQDSTLQNMFISPKTD